ncbi:MAG: GntR family transcriptional regulator [Armatimonadetes bacterium]|nr:GntR family transcriptional regulator [Armatimonadota bacterium]
MLRSSDGARLPAITPEAIVSVNDAVTRVVRDAILRGKFRPGERLVQDDLAAELKVSRQPVREALRRLESEGLIIQLPQRGFVVREYSEGDVRENYYLRQLLECEAARLAAGRILPQELEPLKAANRAMADAVSAQDASSVVERNARFHRLVHESARMPGLVRLINQLWVGLTVLTPLFISGRASRSIREHEAIIAALQAHDAEQADTAMREHIRQASEEYFAQPVPGSAEV